MRKQNGLWLPERFNIIRGGRTIEPKSALRGPRIGVKGHFTVELIHAATGLIKQRLEFDNLITDAGLNGWWTSGSTIGNSMDYAGVGTDSTAPATSDTALGAEISPAADNRTNNNGSISDVATYVGASNYWKNVRTFLFTEAQANGNLTEIGIFDAVTAGILWCRQLLKDGTGTPTTIVKTSSDQLRVTYEYRFYWDPTDFTSTFDVSGNTVDYIIRPQQVDEATSGSWGVGLTALNPTTICGPTGAASNGTAQAYESNALGAVTDAKTGSGTSASSQTLEAYVADDFFREATATWEPGIANFATGIGGLTIGYGGSLNIARLFQVSFPNEQIAKDNTKRFTVTFTIGFGRH